MATKQQRTEKQFLNRIRDGWDLLVSSVDGYPDLMAKHWEFVRFLAARDFPRQWTEADVEPSAVDECLSVLLREVPDELKSKWLRDAEESIACLQSDLIRRGLHHSQLATPEENAASDKELTDELTAMINHAIDNSGLALAD